MADLDIAAKVKEIIKDKLSVDDADVREDASFPTIRLKRFLLWATLSNTSKNTFNKTSLCSEKATRNSEVILLKMGI